MLVAMRAQALALDDDPRTDVHRGGADAQVRSRGILFRRPPVRKRCTGQQARSPPTTSPPDTVPRAASAHPIIRRTRSATLPRLLSRLQPFHSSPLSSHSGQVPIYALEHTYDKHTFFFLERYISPFTAVYLGQANRFHRSDCALTLSQS